MRQAIRALGWAANILWIVIIAFSVTAFLSVMNLGMGFKETQLLPSSDGVVFSLPFFINNGGYYDISDLNVTTCITDGNGTTITTSKTFVPLIARGNKVEATHNISISLNDILSMNYTQLLFNDSFFGLDAIIKLNFAYVIPIQLSTNTTIPWGAPFSNLSIGEISVLRHNNTVVAPLSFENHAFFDVAGTMRFEIYNNVNKLVTSGNTSLNVPSQTEYKGQICMYPSLDDLSRLTENGNVRLIFETPMFTAEWWAPYG